MTNNYHQVVFTYLNLIFSIIKSFEPSIKESIVDVSIVNALNIRKLNDRFFGNDKETDVLSFKNEFEGVNNLGEVIINSKEFLSDIITEECHFTLTGFEAKLSPAESIVIKESVDYKLLLRLFIHSILHLMGYEHINYKKKEVMKAKEDEYFLKVIEHRDYPRILS